MPRTLYITTELPYFPGQAGVMALHLRHLAAIRPTGVVGPRYPHQPEDALQRLRDTVSHSFWWPESATPGTIPTVILYDSSGRWIEWLPRPLQRLLLRRLCGLHRFSNDAVAWRRVLVNLAPKILEALNCERWNIVLLSQSTSASWQPFLPASLAQCIYFHDIRSDYLPHAPTGFKRPDIDRITQEEESAVKGAAAVGFVSDLDWKRAQTLFRPSCPTGVAPLCLDLDYFSLRESSANIDPVVLFTGHLSHPPNIDAVVYFLNEIWPRILTLVPTAQFKIVGAQPAESVTRAVLKAGVTLFANVPDIRPHFREARVYVVPMRFGGGVRNKILEAWAQGVPVVSTRMGAEGLDAQDEVNCWLRDSAEEFADQVAAILKSSPSSAIVSAARVQVEKNHSSAVSSPRLASLLATARMRKKQSVPRVLFDLRWLVRGKVGGLEQMTRRLVSELAEFDRSYEYRFLGSQQICRSLRPLQRLKHRIICTDDAKARYRSWRDGVVSKLTRALGEPPLISEELQALEHYHRLDFTVVHGIPSYVHPDLRRFPSVVTMHDLQHLHLPELFRSEDIATRELEYRESCRLADHVICVSEFTRQDVHRRYGVPLEKMSTIWNLPPVSQQQGSPLYARDPQMLVSMDIRKPFLFYPAQPWLHKNHHVLIQAFEAAIPSLPRGCLLVMTGQPFPADHPAACLLESGRLGERVLHLGYRTPAEVGALYRNAVAMVFASRFEGFGMPVIEAMQQNCPVICGEHTSLPEVAGSAASYADVTSVESLAAAMVSLTRNGTLRDNLRQAGIVNLRRFDRRELAEKHRAIYLEVHSAHFS